MKAKLYIFIIDASIALVIALVFSALFLLSSCKTPTYAQYGRYEIRMGTCPVYPSTKHYRAYGKKFNPKACNFVRR